MSDSGTQLAQPLPMKTFKWLGPCALLVMVGCSAAPTETSGESDDNLSSDSDSLGRDYAAKSAVDKQALLWGKITATAHATPRAWPDRSAVALLAKLSEQDMLVTAQRVSDEMPKGREKLLHARGAVAKIEIVAAPGSPYTGLFQGGIGLARFSLASNPSGGSFTPGLAVKMFVDGKPSSNVMVMYTIDGQDDDYDFFAHTFTNNIPAPRGFGTGLVAGILQRASSTPGRLDVAQLAQLDRSGKAVAAPKSPRDLDFEPTPGMKAFHQAGTQGEFRDDLAKIPEGTVVYKITATESGHRVVLGDVVTRSKLVSSTYGDEKLFFKHSVTNPTHVDPHDK